MDGNVQTYKGRLVAKGFGQIHDIDYDETFSHVAMFKYIRILLAVAAFHDYEIWQMDVKTAFLNGKLEEDVYMTQPEDFVTLENARKVCKLQRSIYGLKQASQSWNLCFNEAIQEFGFIRNEDEPCVCKKFSGSIVSFLILKRTNESNPISSAIGSIMYAMICTRPDLSYALSMASRYQANPGKGHWTVVKNILKYFRKTKDVSLVYGGKEELGIKGYIDASFQTDKDDSQSQSGFEFCLNKDTVS
ncbi:hypothetical protein V6N13_123126 [Hibiscus sabdariffa]